MGIIIRQSVKGTVVSYVGIAIGFFTTFFVLTNFLTAEEIGLTRVLVDAATVFAGLAQLGTTSSAIRYYPYFKEGEKDHGFFFWTLVIPFIGFLIYGIVFWLLKEPISGFFAENSPLFVDYYNFIFPVGFFLLYGIPVLFGPNHTKFEEAQALIEAGAAFCISSQNDLEDELDKFLASNKTLTQAGENARNYVKEKSGGTAKILDVLKTELFKV
jgi:hypothetical protein